MPTVAPAPRAICATCLRAQSACICRWVTPVPEVEAMKAVRSVEVLILQHPMEVRNAKNSARLLHLSLPGSRLWTGEVFDDAALHAALFGPMSGDVSGDVRGDVSPQAILLYPDTPHDQAQDLQPPPALLPETLCAAAGLRLVVLDATWRKSRKMLYLSPLLQRLPRLALVDTPSSRYLIRKAHRPDQLSTLEATCAALRQLEGEGARFDALLAAFDGFVAQQAAYGPA